MQTYNPSTGKMQAGGSSPLLCCPLEVLYVVHRLLVKRLAVRFQKWLVFLAHGHHLYSRSSRLCKKVREASTKCKTESDPGSRKQEAPLLHVYSFKPLFELLPLTFLSDALEPGKESQTSPILFQLSCHLI